MPLRIPTGWAVRHNGFFEAAHPTLNESEDLLWLERVHPSDGVSTGESIDLGWYGDREHGTFRLVRLQGGWDNERERFESRDRAAIVRELERWLSPHSER
jgi:hypothetical protein